MKGRWAVLMAMAVLGPGCSFGPRALERTHGRYAEAVRRVDEEQLLRGLLHLRYREAPVGLDVTAIAAQYELSASAEARPFFGTESSSNIFRSFSRVLPDVSAGGANRPTISLVPKDDSSSVRQFLTPITSETLVFLGRTGWPLSTILRLYVERINGIENAPGAPLLRAGGDYARFNRIAELAQVVQERQWASLVVEERPVVVGGPFPDASGTPAAAVDAVSKGLELRRGSDGRSWHLVRPERRLVLAVNEGARNEPEVRELYSLLHLDPARARFDFTITTEPPASRRVAPFTELRLRPRSTAQVHLYLGYGIDLPAAHLARGIVQLPLDLAGEPFDGREVTRGLFAVHCCASHKPPVEAYVAVRYRGHWFYIDDRDTESKATFALMLQLSTLDFGKQRLGAGPTLTLPVGR